MAIQSASAALSSEFIQLTVTGLIVYQDGDLDLNSGTIKALRTGSWSSLAGTTWGTFGSYANQTQTIKWTAPRIDLGAVQYFTLNIQSEFIGELSYLIHVSDTGIFGGEQSEYYIQEGDLNVNSFYGQFVYVTAIVKGDELRRMTITSNTNTVSYRIPNVNTSTLSGTATARVIPLPTSVSSIKDINIEPKAATPYAVNLYVSDTATSVILIPVVVSKSATAPSFALYGIDNDPRDGIVDITVTALPRQVMLGGNLIVLE